MQDKYLLCDADTSVADTEYLGYVDTKHKDWVMILKKVTDTVSNTVSYRYHIAQGDYATLWAARLTHTYVLPPA